MEFDVSRINKLYKQDRGLVFVFILFVWAVLGFVLKNVLSLAMNDLIRNVALVAGLLAGIFVTSALVAVLAHLKKNRIALYSEELHNTTIKA
ncbi:hypothetical protein UF75_5267 [Desulfosporosinus sp. I2]|uniref:hypothetical protein n=1 Tax=Desulfosporosinus sp. I2 TaxID=1617025 RepID=UPI0005F0BD9B|nr:hypothetical protein [Desulfosporosinus sp. I2]KJR44354.1 hypothetical protein UF75_5267 [Desulfosporosinus sp. I2]